jgi:hypothetical protein
VIRKCKPLIRKYKVPLVMLALSLVLTLVVIISEKFSTDVTCERTQTHVEMNQRIVDFGDCGESRQVILEEPLR